MWLPVAMLAGGIVVGLVAGGHWRAIGTSGVRVWPIGVVGLACTILPWIGDQSGTTALVAAGWGLLIAFALVNIHLTGMAIVAVGLGCNLVALVANKAMPVRESAAIEAGLATSDTVTTTELGPGRRLAEPGDRLEVLTAIIPIPAFDMVVTFGDLIALVGLADLGFRLVKRRAPRHSAARRPARAHAASKKRAAVPLPAWAAVPEPKDGLDDWVLDLREMSGDPPPVLASLAPEEDDEDDDAPPPLVVRYSGEPLPSRR
jgi:hypothetical protein